MTRLIVALVAVAVVAGCSKSSPPPPAPQQQASCTRDEWRVEHSPNMPRCVGNSFKFPKQDGAHYFTRKADSIKQGSVITFRFTIAGPGTLVPTGKGDEPPATVSIHVTRKGTDITKEEHADWRWWSESTTLTAGEHTIRAVVAPANHSWIQMRGQPASTRPQEFAKAFAEAGRIGFTFGGKFFRGHGVKANGGDVSITIHEFSVK